MKQQFQQSNNLSSIMIYTGSSYLTAADALARRDYGYFIDDLGYLSLASDKRSYWSYYKTEDLMFADTQTSFGKMKDLYNAAYSYQTNYYDNYTDGLGIRTITGDGKSISRYHTKYSYQNDLDNDFSNIVGYTATDLNNFLFSLNYQKYNKMSQYGSNNEVSTIRIGAKTFDWHNALDVAYTIVNFEEKEIFFAYTISEDNKVAYYNKVEDLVVPTGYSSYQTTYNAVAYTYTYYTYGADNYYTYAKKEYVPIYGTLESTIAYQISQFEDKYDNNIDLYTYYMYDCGVDIPMVITSNSLGTKKSTFEMRYYSDYDKWFETGIPAYFNFSSDTPNVAFVAYNDGTFGMRINENENIFDSDKHVAAQEEDSFDIELGDNEYSYTTEFTILSPNNMQALSITNPAGVINLTKTGWTSKENHLEKLEIKNTNAEKDMLDKVLGVNDLVNLKEFVIDNCFNLKSTPSMSKLTKLEKFDVTNSNIESFKPADGAKLKYVALPDRNSLKTLRLKDIKFEEDSIFIIPERSYYSLNSLTLDNVTGIDTFEIVNTWSTILKNASSLIPKSLIHLEMNKFNWEFVPVTIMEDIKKFDLNIKEGNISLVGTGNYGMLTREEYISMTKLYGVNAFVKDGNEKTFKDLNLTKFVDTLQSWEYTFNLASTVDSQKYIARFNYSENYNATENTNSIIAVNAIIGKILEKQTLNFIYDELENNIYCKLDSMIDTKDTPYTNANIEFGDIVLYNGNTIKIFTNSVSNNKYNYIKLGKVNDISNLMNWYYVADTDNIFITFTQAECPEVISEITVYDSENNQTNSIETVEDDEFIISVDIDNYNAAAHNIAIKASPELASSDWSAVTVSADSENENDAWPKKYHITIDSTKANIAAFGSKNFPIRVVLNEKLEDENFSEIKTIDLSNIIYTDINITALSKVNTIAEYNETEDMLTFNSRIASVDEDGFLVIDANAEYDEENEILTLS